MTQMVRLFLIRVTAYVGFRITQPKVIYTVQKIVWLMVKRYNVEVIVIFDKELYLTE